MSDPLRFAADLRDAAAEVGLTPRLLAERPEEWRLGRLTVVVDRARRTAQIRYARTAVGRAPCDAAAVMSGCRRALARLAKESLSPDELAAALAAAYGSLAGQPGAPVALLDLWPEVGRAAERRKYSRAQFVWDIARLRSEQGLALPQGRISMDVATGAPGRALWIEDETGTGQYYRSFRLVPHP
jgi:hypothetical protein